VYCDISTCARDPTRPSESQSPPSRMYRSAARALLLLLLLLLLLSLSLGIVYVATMCHFTRQVRGDGGAHDFNGVYNKRGAQPLALPPCRYYYRLPTVVGRSHVSREHSTADPASPSTSVITSKF